MVNNSDESNMRVEGVEPVTDEFSMQRKIWNLADRVRGIADISSILVPLSAVLYLRHLDQVSGVLPPGVYEGWRRSVLDHGSSPWVPNKGSREVLVESGVQSDLAERCVDTLLNHSRFSGDPRGGLLQEILRVVEELPADKGAEFLDVALEVITHRTSRFEIISPRPLVELMVQLAEIRPGNTVYDPAFGTASLLTMAWDSAVRHVGGDSSVPILFGQEMNPDAHLIGSVRLGLREINGEYLVLGDTISAPRYSPENYGGFDRVLCVPPMGRGNLQMDNTRFASRKIEAQFLYHIARSLKPQGRAVVAVPNGILFSRSEAELRRWLATDFQLEGIVSLPAGALGTFTNIESSLIILSNRPALSSIAFIDGRELPGFKHHKGDKPVRWGELLSSITDQLSSSALHKEALSVPIETLEQRGWSFAPNRSAMALENLIQRTPDAEWLPLAEIAKIYSGLRVVSRLPSEGAEEERFLRERVVRVRDLPASPGPIRKELERNWIKITPVQAEQRRLHKDDLVLSADGTVGKIGIVDSAIAGALPATGVFVLRPYDDQLSDQLMRTLSLAPFKEWLVGEAVGTIIKHLSIDSVRQLKVPLRPDRLHLQDADEYLLMQLGVLNRTLRLGDASEGESQITLLSRTSTSLRNYLAHTSLAPDTASIVSDDDMDELRRLIGILTGVADIPPSSARFAVLQAALYHSRLTTHGKSSVFSQLRIALERIVEGELRRLAQDGSLELQVSPSEVMTSRPVALTVQVRNEGSLPLRDVRGRIIDNDQSKYFGFLPEHQSADWDVVLPAQPTPGLMKIDVQISGMTIEGALIQQHLSAEIMAKVDNTEYEEKPLSANPYVAGNPIENKRKDMFFGRDDLIGSIVRQLGTVRTGNSVLLEGNRRVGKTSILKQLEANPEIDSAWIPIYCSFQGGGGADGKLGMPTSEVYRLLTRRLGLAVHKSGYDVELASSGIAVDTGNFRRSFSAQIQATFNGEVDSFDLFDSYLSEVLERVKPKKVLFLLDEFDKIKEGIESGVTSPMVPENLRYLIQTYSGLAMVFSGAKRLKELREGYWSSFFGIGRRIPVGAIDLESARLLVTEPVRGILTYTDEARDLIVRLAACQPFMIQSLCNYVFEDCAITGDRIVTTDMVDRSSSELVEDNEHLASLWDFAGTDAARLALYNVADLGNGPDVADLVTIESSLLLQGAELDEELLETTLSKLEEKELLMRERSPNGDKGHVYAVSLPLFSTWILRYKNLDEVLRRALRELEG